VAAPLEDYESRTGDGLVDAIGDEGSHIDVVAAGYDHHGKLEFVEFGIQIETREVMNS
jgi:hypothetical protein